MPDEPVVALRSCTNCGEVLEENRLTECKVYDLCKELQNRDIIGLFTHAELTEKLKVGRVFAEASRPLCYKCAAESNYKCYVCELHLSLEGMK